MQTVEYGGSRIDELRIVTFAGQQPAERFEDIGLVVCDQEGRILALGRGIFELTGWGEGELMGHDIVSGLGLAGFDLGQNPVALALEWGVRRLGEELELRTKAGLVKPVIADLFPAYDADGGLLVALSPRA